jgi:glycerate kinase
MCDHFNNKLDILPEEFHKACKIKWNYNNLPFKIECIIDVENEVIGKSGATYQFGSQKGATRGELAVMELGFTKILNLLYNDRILDQSLKLFGAGGGLSAGCQIFFNAKCVHSTDFIISNLNKKLGNWKPDIVVTGEGSFDEQSLSGKGTATIINYFSKNTDKVFLCSGRVDKSITNRLPSNVVLIQLMDFFNSEEESIQSFETGISKASKIIVEGIDC